jgi:hypothetical protein
VWQVRGIDLGAAKWGRIDHEDLPPRLILDHAEPATNPKDPTVDDRPQARPAI